MRRTAGPALPVWRLVGASVAGEDHVTVGRVNQDSLVVDVLTEGGGFVLAVADGAGSRSRSERGSGFAVEAMKDTAAHLLAQGRPRTGQEWRRFLTRLVEDCFAGFDARVQDDLVRSTGSFDAGLRREFATTLLSVVAVPPFYCVVSVGDGYMVAGRADAPATLLVAPPPRADAGVTEFLTSDDRHHRHRSFVVYDPALNGLALFTDGLAEGLLQFRSSADGPVPVVPTDFRRYFTYASDGGTPGDLAGLIAGPRFAATSGDDKTLVLAACPAG